MRLEDLRTFPAALLGRELEDVLVLGVRYEDFDPDKPVLAVGISLPSYIVGEACQWVSVRLSRHPSISVSSVEASFISVVLSSLANQS